ncbi:MAG: hypothetical protein JNK76_13965 [Planctomycetales bacterium]|nr:hypothetical protein [Planctomycetales bacterium]
MNWFFWNRKPANAPPMTRVDAAKRVLTNSEAAGYGYFNHISPFGYFPPLEFLNQFLVLGHETWDQDGMHERWKPFELSPEEHCEVANWWIEKYPGTVVHDLGAKCWDDWLFQILHPDDEFK